MPRPISKVLIATGVYPPESGGPATYTKLLEERLPALGFEVRVLPFRVVRHLPKLLRHVSYFFTCMSLARGIDIIYAQDTVSVGLPAALAAKLLGKKFVVRVPGDYAWEQARQRFNVADELDIFQTKKYGIRVEFLRRTQQFVVNRADKIVVPSFYMKDLVSGWTDRNKIMEIYSSIHMPVLYELPKNRPQGFLIICVARLVPWKCIDNLIKVVNKHADWQLVIVGDGPDSLRLRNMAGENIHFVGELPNKQAVGWIKSASVFVLNSTYEGLSHVLVEAMALGIPAIATEAGGNIELLEHGRGLLIPIKNAEKLEQSIVEVRDNISAARERSTRAQEYAKEQFDISLSINKLRALFKTL